MMLKKNEPSIIITLKIDETSQLFFDDKRKVHYPKHANFAPAHITLLHKLPNNQKNIKLLKFICSNTKVTVATISSILCNGRYVAYAVNSIYLIKLHKEMLGQFGNCLLAKDRSEYKPHSSIQNGVTFYKAQKTKEHLEENFTPFTVNIVGLSLWEFNKKGWIFIEDIYFTKK